MEAKNNSFLNEIRYYGLFDKIQESIIIFDIKCDDNDCIIDLVIKYINPVAAKNFNVERNKITGFSFNNLYGLEVTAPYLDMANKIYNKKKYTRFETYFAPLNKYFLVSASFLDDSYFTLNIDITERKYRFHPREDNEKKVEELKELTRSLKNEIKGHKKAEMELKENERNLKAIIESSPDSITVADMDLNIILCNQATVDMYGASSKEELVGLNAFNLVDPEDHDKLVEIMKKIMLEKKSINLELNLFTMKDDRFFPAEISGNIIYDDEGNPTAFVAITKDISERKNAENALKESEEKFRELFNNANDMISLNLMKENGLPGRFIEVNEVGTERLEYSKDELLNMSPVDIVAPDKRIEMPKNAMELWTKGHAKFEIIHVAKNGKRIPVEVNNHLFKLKGKTVALAISRDITERKKTEKEMKKLIDNLKRSNDELEQFAYVASHDLQEPLRTIASFTQLLERRYKGKFDSDADEFMNYVIGASIRMKDQIEGLLEFSRVTRGEKTFKCINMNDILNNAIYNLKTLIEENNARITYDPLPELTGDADQLQRVFQNIISNALKFRKKNEGPNIHISVQRDKENNEYVFKVADNGIGIEKQYMERIFVIFRRLHTQEEYKGTGIGLSIVKRIIERHNGRIWVESEVGKGSTFYFTIPLQQPEDQRE